MRKRQLLLSILIITILFLGVPALSDTSSDIYAQSFEGKETPQTRTSGAGTEATNNDCRITVTVYIAFAFQNDAVRSKADTLIDKWIFGAQSVWNNGQHYYGPNSCPVHIEVVGSRLDEGMNCDPHSPAYSGVISGWHCINVGIQDFGNKESQYNRWQAITPQGSLAFSDIATTQEPNRWGSWSELASGRDAAHAIGHLLGLPDDYGYADTNNDGNSDTYTKAFVDPQSDIKSIMAQTWGDVGPRREHITEIVQLWGGACTEQCYCGNGRIDDTQNEECDLNAEKNTCPEKEICSAKCTCIYDTSTTPVCGDGYIHTRFEQCDPNAIPSGCTFGYTCHKCQCITDVLGESKTDQTVQSPDNAVDTTPGTVSKLRVAPRVLNFDQSNIQGTFTISNENGAPFDWRITENFPDWIQSVTPIKPQEGNKTGREVIWITVNLSNVKSGFHTHDLQVISKIGKETVTINLSV